YHFFNAAAAKELLDAVERFAPQNGAVLSSLGAYWADQENSEKAKSYYQRAIEAAPGLPDGYVGIGEIFEGELKLAAAEEWYRKAVAAVPGSSSGYLKLLRLYGRRETFESREGALRPLAERAIAAEPDDEYDAFAGLGEVYRQNERLEQAQAWFEKAIAVD